MEIISEYLESIDDVHKRSICYLDYKQHRWYPWTIIDMGAELRGYSIYTHDLLITDKDRYLALCTLMDIEPSDGSSFYLYLEILHPTYSYH